MLETEDGNGSGSGEPTSESRLSFAVEEGDRLWIRATSDQRWGIGEYDFSATITANPERENAIADNELLISIEPVGPDPSNSEDSPEIPFIDVLPTDSSTPETSTPDESSDAPQIDIPRIDVLPTPPPLIDVLP